MRLLGLDLMTDFKSLEDLVKTDATVEDLQTQFPGLLEAVIEGRKELARNDLIAARVTYLNFRIQVWAQAGFDADPTAPVRVLPAGWSNSVH